MVASMSPKWKIGKALDGQYKTEKPYIFIPYKVFIRICFHFSLRTRNEKQSSSKHKIN
jgi:hypothetical protein